jgi:Flp pilus assembly protein TadB
MTAVLLAGIGTGLGLTGLLVAVHRARPSLAAAIFDLHAGQGALASKHPRDSVAVWRVDRRIALSVARAIRRRGPLNDRHWALLAVTETSLEDLCNQAVASGAVACLLPWLLWVLAAGAGLGVPVAVPLWLAVLLPVAGAALPVVMLGARAKECRRAARGAVGSFVELVVLGLAGGMGIEGALFAAAQVGDNRLARRIESALTSARHAGEPPWDALARLGKQPGVDELDELAAALSLAGNEGARIRATLAAKAASIRRHDLADAEAEANTVTERLFLPGVLLLAGFLLFVGYPAYARIATGF